MRLPTVLFILIFAMIGHMSFAQSHSRVGDLIADYKFQVEYVNWIQKQKSLTWTKELVSKLLLFIHGLATYLPSWNKNIESLEIKISMRSH